MTEDEAVCSWMRRAPFKPVSIYLVILGVGVVSLAFILNNAHLTEYILLVIVEYI